MSRSTEFTCRELVEALTDYLEGAMPADDRARLEAHLADCDGCTNALLQFRDTIRVTGHLTEEQVAEPSRESIRQVFRRWSSDQEPEQAR